MEIRLHTPEHQYVSNGKTVFGCEYHIVWCVKYRRSVLSAEMRERLKTILLESQTPDIYLVRGLEAMPDHVHVLVSIPPDKSVSQAIRYMKGVTSRVLRQEFPELESRLPTLWTRGKFVATTGDVTLETLKKYIESQQGL